LQRDVAAGQPAELDAIAGPILRAGARHGLDVTATAALAEAIRSRLVAP